MLHRQINHNFSLIGIFLTIALSSLAIFGQTTDKCELLSVQKIERQMSGAETHCYRIDLLKDQFLQVKVEQKGIDVALKFYDSNQKLITEIDSPNGTKGFEVLALAASETGVYKLEISSSEADAPKGNYIIFQDVLRVATQTDRQKFEAQQAFAQGKNSTSPPETLKLFQKAGELFETINDKKGAADSFSEVGFTSISLGDGRTALLVFEKALQLYKDISDQREVAKTIKYIGYIYFVSGNVSKALEQYEQAVPLFHTSDAEDKADTLQAIGDIYLRMTELSKALENYQEALTLFSAIANTKTEAGIVNNIGLIYLELGQKQKALENFTKALSIAQKNSYKKEETVSLTNIGRAYDDLGDKIKARENFSLALSITDDKQAKASILVSIGKADFDSGDQRKALESFDQSLKLFREIGDKFGESSAINAIARAYSGSGDKQKAVEYYNSALQLQRNIGFKRGEGLTFGNLMSVWQNLGNRRLAIFYGKQSVNRFQQIRSDIQKFDEESQRSFVKLVEVVYRTLAVILMDEGRISEAQEVLGLLKEEEFYQYTRRSPDSIPNLIRQLELNVEETEAAQKSNDWSDKITAATKRAGELELEKRSQPLSTEKQAELQKLQSELVTLNVEFAKYSKELAETFSKLSLSKNAEQANSQTRIWQKRLAQFDEKAVLLTTLVTENKYYVIITTPTAQTVRSIGITKTDLDKKIVKLRQILENPRTNPLPATQELYQLLVKPIESDLVAMNAKTLLWSLDGTLRYIPFAALHDGEKFLVEKYTNINVTLAQPPKDLAAIPQTWRALGAGVSVGFESLEPLINVPSELKMIVRDEKSKNPKSESGIFDGKRLVNQEFSRSNLTTELKQNFQLVHFATHFVFRPGKDIDSFLLLGNGEKLNLADLRTDKSIDFKDIDLLTLSACETALGTSEANGVEIESFGVIAQQRGARSVIASLWSIADNVTPKLMIEFYRQYRQGNGKISKAEALRQAQISILKNSGKKQNYAHPTYWAAFTILGDWR